MAFGLGPVRDDRRARGWPARPRAGCRATGCCMGGEPAKLFDAFMLSGFVEELAKWVVLVAARVPLGRVRRAARRRRLWRRGRARLRHAGEHAVRHPAGAGRRLAARACSRSRRTRCSARRWATTRGARSSIAAGKLWRDRAALSRSRRPAFTGCYDYALASRYGGARLDRDLVAVRGVMGVRSAPRPSRAARVTFSFRRWRVSGYDSRMRIVVPVRGGGSDWRLGCARKSDNQAAPAAAPSPEFDQKWSSLAAEGDRGLLHRGRSRRGADGQRAARAPRQQRRAQRQGRKFDGDAGGAQPGGGAEGDPPEPGRCPRLLPARRTRRQPAFGQGDRQLRDRRRRRRARHQGRRARVPGHVAARLRAGDGVALGVSRSRRRVGWRSATRSCSSAGSRA